MTSAPASRENDLRADDLGGHLLDSGVDLCVALRDLAQQDVGDVPPLVGAPDLERIRAGDSEDHPQVGVGVELGQGGRVDPVVPGRDRLLAVGADEDIGWYPHFQRGSSSSSSRSERH